MTTRLQVVATWLSLALSTVGCGPAMYLQEVSEAETQVEKAEADNGKIFATYEYYAAASCLEKAKEEASEGHYEDAARLAVQAQELAKRAQRRASHPSDLSQEQR